MTSAFENAVSKFGYNPLNFRRMQGFVERAGVEDVFVESVAIRYFGDSDREEHAKLTGRSTESLVLCDVFSSVLFHEPEISDPIPKAEDLSSVVALSKYMVPQGIWTTPFNVVARVGSGSCLVNRLEDGTIVSGTAKLVLQNQDSVRLELLQRRLGLLPKLRMLSLEQGLQRSVKNNIATNFHQPNFA